MNAMRLPAFAVVLGLLCAAGVAAADAPLADAAKRHDATAVHALLANGADVNAAQVDGATALHWAAYHDDTGLTTRLIQSGANVKLANRYGVTPLSLACTNGNPQIVRLLLDAGADPNGALPGGETVLMTAARTGNSDVVKALLASGADVHAKESRSQQTALMWAAAEGHVAVAEALLEAGADLHTRVASGFTPFLFAVREGHIPMARALVAAGVNVNETIQRPTAGVRSSQGRGWPASGTSALVLAVTNGHFELASYLLDAGANPNAAIPGLTALHVITVVRKPGGGDNDPAPRGSGNMTSLELVRKLKERGADLNARMTRKVALGLTGLNTLGATPFLLAAKSADAELMRTLAALGADPLIPNADGATPIIVAAGLGTRSPGEDAGTESEVIEAVQAALDLGNDINAVDNNGETAMHGAAYKNLPGVVEFLGKKGARIDVWNRKNRFGWTPLLIAEGYRFGNFKPSPVTVAAIRKLMTAAGAPTTVEPPPTGGANSNYKRVP
jgi:ankyrin repeat protein